MVSQSNLGLEPKVLERVKPGRRAKTLGMNYENVTSRAGLKGLACEVTGKTRCSWAERVTQPNMRLRVLRVPPRANEGGVVLARLARAFVRAGCLLEVALIDATAETKNESLRRY